MPSALRDYRFSAIIESPRFYQMGDVTIKELGDEQQ
jgi:hypothetical protein